MKKSTKFLSVFLCVSMLVGMNCGFMVYAGASPLDEAAYEEPVSEAKPGSAETAEQDAQAALPADTEPEDAQEQEDVADPEATPEPEVTPDEDALEPEPAEDPEVNEEPGDQVPAEAGNGTSETGQAGVEPIADGYGKDYYVVWDGVSKLTFQTSRPSGEENTDFWGQVKTDSFLSTHNDDQWHSDEIKNKVTEVEFNGNIELYGQFMFKGFSALKSVKADGKITIAQGNRGDTNANQMFGDCASLTTVDIKELAFEDARTNDQGEIKVDMNSMFMGCSSLTELDLSGWDTSNVTDMSLMFGGCTSLEKLTLTGAWNTSKVTDMHAIFGRCIKLKTIEGLGNFDFASLQSLSEVFESCESLTELDLSNWDTTRMSKTSLLFSDCPELRKITVGQNFILKDTEGSSKQIHTASTTGVWVKENALTGQRWSDEELITMFERGNAPGTYIWVHELNYGLNIEEVPGGENLIKDENVYKYDAKAELKDISAITDDPMNDGKAFVGWSMERHGKLVETPEEENNAGIIESNSVTFNDHNITVYAVWAVDENNNNTPDYEEWVTITFDINGGDGSQSPEEKHRGTYTEDKNVPGLHLRMYTYILKWTKTWNKDDGQPAEHPAILVGWSTEKIDDIILENDRDADGANIHDTKLVNRTTMRVPEVDTTYYAVYAADENNDWIPDYLENSVHVEYYANGGERVDGLGWIDGIDELFYRCSHHHVPFEDGIVLLDLESGKNWIERDGATLLGWSEEQVKDLVTSAEGAKSANIVTEVTMPDAGNKHVYAVWAVDSNNNQTPDYEEGTTPTPTPPTRPHGSVGTTRYHVTVEAGDHGTVTASPTTAAVGQRVTVTVTPDDGYVLDSLVAYRANGGEVQLTGNANGTYTFSMPGTDVTVEATFVAVEPQQPPLPESGLPFTDVAPNAWYVGAVQYMYDHGYIAGTSNTTFSPDMPTTRAQLVTILYHIAGTPTYAGTRSFGDVAPGAWYYDAVTWAAENGVVAGFEDGSFQPDAVVTRQQLAAILHAMSMSNGLGTGAANVDLTKFNDYASIPDWALAHMQWACNIGIIGGTADGYLNPTSGASRAEVAQILMNYLNLTAGA